MKTIPKGWTRVAVGELKQAQDRYRNGARWTPYQGSNCADLIGTPVQETNTVIRKKMVGLTFSEFAAASRARDIEWMGHPPVPEDLLFNSVELAGETGEACNWVKKLSRTRMGIAGGVSEEKARAELSKELADVVICAHRVAAVENIDLGAAVLAKFNETSIKHGFKVIL
jgi:NTP pyrophosphatase (non-canonical NTP hydrolase)